MSMDSDWCTLNAVKIRLGSRKFVKLSDESFQFYGEQIDWCDLGSFYEYDDSYGIIVSDNEYDEERNTPMLQIQLNGYRTNGRTFEVVFFYKKSDVILVCDEEFERERYAPNLYSDTWVNSYHLWSQDWNGGELINKRQYDNDVSNWNTVLQKLRKGLGSCFHCLLETQWPDNFLREHKMQSCLKVRESLKNFESNNEYVEWYDCKVDWMSKPCASSPFVATTFGYNRNCQAQNMRRLHWNSLVERAKNTEKVFAFVCGSHGAMGAKSLVFQLPDNMLGLIASFV